MITKYTNYEKKKNGELSVWEPNKKSERERQMRLEQMPQIVKLFY